MASAVDRVSARRLLGLPEDAAIVTLIARFDPHKRHDVLLRAVARLRTRFPRVHVLINGEIFDGTAVFCRVQELIGELHLQDHVSWIPLWRTSEWFTRRPMCWGCAAAAAPQRFNTGRKKEPKRIFSISPILLFDLGASAGGTVYASIGKLDAARLATARSLDPGDQRVPIARVADALREVVLQVFEDDIALPDSA